MTLTKAQLIENLMNKLDFSHKDAEKIVNSFFDVIKDSLAEGEEVKISGFGNFNILQKASRPGRNPKTGDIVPVTARTVTVFRPGKKLNTRIKNIAE